jgi:hypothetical protein
LAVFGGRGFPGGGVLQQGDARQGGWFERAIFIDEVFWLKVTDVLVFIALGFFAPGIRWQPSFWIV